MKSRLLFARLGSWLFASLLAMPFASAEDSAASKLPAPAPMQVEDVVDQPAKPLRPIRPEYPSRMLSSEIQGEVLLRFVVDADGVPRHFEVVRSSHDEFSRAAISAVSRTPFRPAQLRGAAVASRVLLPVKFVLADD